MKPRLMRANRWTLQRLKSVCVQQVVGVQELSGTCVSERTRRNTFLILMLTLLTTIQKPGPCVRILFQIWIPTRNFMQGDNQNRVSGQALEFKQLNIHAWEAFDKGHDVHMQAAPSQTELLYKNYKVNKKKLKSEVKETIMEKYGNAAMEEQLPRELLLGQSEREVEYDRAGRIMKGQEQALPRSKYEEDVHINNHRSVWGSWWKDHQWGYKCCKQIMRNSYCTGAAGIEAAEAAGDQMWANIYS